MTYFGRGFDSRRLHQLTGETVDCYVVWYRLSDDDVDRIRGVARNWKRAERMASNLKLWLKASEKSSEIIVGVKRGEHGKLYDDEELSLRWTVE